MYIHVSDNKFTEGGSVKFSVKSNDNLMVQNQGVLCDREYVKLFETY